MDYNRFPQAHPRFSKHSCVDDELFFPWLACQQVTVSFLDTTCPRYEIMMSDQKPLCCTTFSKLLFFISSFFPPSFFLSLKKKENDQMMNIYLSEMVFFRFACDCKTSAVLCVPSLKDLLVEPVLSVKLLTLTVCEGKKKQIEK